MTYELWTEKYRPKRLDDIKGQDHVIKHLKAFVKQKNMPHLLFTGPPGVGKTASAIALARELYGEENWRENFLELNASVSKNTPILVKINGRIKRTTFEELDKIYFTEDRIIRFDGGEYVKVDNLEVLTLDKETKKVKWAKAKYIIRHKANKILRIKVEGGGTIELTGNHSVIVLDENGNLTIKHAKDLKVGDYLISFVTKLSGNVNEIEIESEVYNKNPRTVIVQKLKITNDLAWMFGLFVAEGAIGFRGYTSGQIIFTVNYPKEIRFIEKIKEIAEELDIPYYINLTSSGFNRDRFSAVQIRLLSTQLARAFSEWFYTSDVRNAHTKRIPSFIYELPLELRIEFLKGVFDGDGSGKWGEVARISSVSKELLIDLVWLSRISGIESSVFNKEMRLIWKGKMKYKKSNLLPAKPFIKFFEKIEDKIKINWRHILRHQLYGNKERISKEKLLYILKNVEVAKLSEEEKKEYYKLLSLVKSDIYIVKIKSIEVIDYNDYVYDISVPRNEMFFAGEIPILLHNSDERGIDVIRQKVKDFARTKPIGDVPFKIVFLDEADAMTRDAQQALRRIMEMYSSVTRFILSCNYSSKIIEPIQSRCTIFRFKPLPKEAVFEILQKIIQNEGLEVEEGVLEALYNISEGDMRKAINILQAAAMVSKHITVDLIYEIASVAKPKEVREILELALKGQFREARQKLFDTMIRYGLAGEDMIRLIQKEVWNLQIDDKTKLEILDKIGEIEFRMVEGSDPVVQLDALLAFLALKRWKR